MVTIAERHGSDMGVLFNLTKSNCNREFSNNLPHAYASMTAVDRVVVTYAKVDIPCANNICSVQKLRANCRWLSGTAVA